MGNNTLKSLDVLIPVLSDFMFPVGDQRKRYLLKLTNLNPSPSPGKCSPIGISERQNSGSSNHLCYAAAITKRCIGMLQSQNAANAAVTKRNNPVLYIPTNALCFMCPLVSGYAPANTSTNKVLKKREFGAHKPHSQHQTSESPRLRTYCFLYALIHVHSDSCTL